MMKTEFFLKILVILCLINVCHFQQEAIIKPVIIYIQRYSLDSFRIKWMMPNQANNYYLLTKYRIFIKKDNSKMYQEWPSQVLRVAFDGRDAETVGVFQVNNTESCIEKCIENSDCRFIVKNYAICYLKDAVPSGTCAVSDECISVKKYYHEAEINNLPLNNLFRVAVQVYDAKSQSWSGLSNLSNNLCTTYEDDESNNNNNSTYDFEMFFD